MSFVGKSQSKRLVAVHGWSGTVLGLFLYLVILTGSVAVFAHEIGRWSATSSARPEAPLAGNIDGLLRRIVDDVDPAYREEIQVYGNSGGALVAFPHGHEKNAKGQLEDKGVKIYANSTTGEILKREEGFRSEMTGDDESAYEHFITRLHINLHLPGVWGLFATGILGLVMLSAVVSGLILHKHVLRDIFTPPRFSSLLLNRRDRHILAGSWGLPFGFVLAFTGTFYSFAGSLGLPVVAMVAFGGDQEAMVEAVLGSPETEEVVPAPFVNLDTVLADFSERSGSAPEFLTISHWGQSNASITVYNAPDGEQLTGENYAYDGVSGAFEGLKPLLGNEPSLGGSLVGLMGPLHFGNFGGLLSKVVWLSLGLAMCYVTLTGLQLWTARRADERAWAFLPKTIAAFGYGVPIALAGAAAGFFVTFHSGVASTNVGVWSGFTLTALIISVLSVSAPDQATLGDRLAFIIAGSIFALPFIRDFSGGSSWQALFAYGDFIVIGVDLVLLIGAGTFLVMRALPRRLKPTASMTAQAPAE